MRKCSGRNCENAKVRESAKSGGQKRSRQSGSACSPASRVPGTFRVFAYFRVFAPGTGPALRAPAFGAPFRTAVQAERQTGRRKDMKGYRLAFTLIELLVVIAIIAILAAILFPVFAQARAQAR